MAEHGLLYLAGVEVGNNARVLGYLSGAGGGRSVVTPGCACIEAAAVGDAPYTSPDADPAPWYDPGEPESGRFGGVWIENIEGLSDSTLTRSVTQRLGDGAIISSGRRANKTLTVTGWLFAADCCAADYGLRWLTAALSTACSACDGDDLCFLSCCPQVVPEGTPGAAQGPDGQWWDTPAQTRTLTGAAVLSGPTVLQRARGCESVPCGEGAALRPMYQVQWVISTDPCVWRNPVPVIDQGFWPLPTGDEPCNIEWSTDCCDLARPGCSCTGPCQGNPGCPAPAPPPVPPPATPSCVCIPLQVVRQCVDIGPDLVPTWEQASLMITVRAGSQAIRNMTINVWPNPLDHDPDQLDECQACGTYYISHVPADSVLTIDGRTCTATTVCPGNAVRNAAGDVYGSLGGPMSCVTLSCGVRYTLCADVDIHHVAPDASLSVSLVRCEAVA